MPEGGPKENLKKTNGNLRKVEGNKSREPQGNLRET
jgi:hypothetical protein